MISRGVAAFLGGFTLLNVIGELFIRGFGANDFWIDLRPIPPVIAAGFLVVVGAALFACTLWPGIVSRFRHACVALLLVVAFFALLNVILLILMTLGWITWRVARPSGAVATARSLSRRPCDS